MIKTFEEIYSELTSKDNRELEIAWLEARKARKKAKNKALIICLICDLIAMLFLGRVMITHLIVCIIIIFIGAFINFIMYFIIYCMIYNTKKQEELTKQYKSLIINELINNFYNDVNYNPKKGMPEKIYKALRYENYDIYSSEDYFEAKINNKYNVQMAEILTKSKREIKNSEGEIEEEFVTEFIGLFAKIEMEKSINNELRIMQNDKGLVDGHVLKMDYSEFEKYFDVITGDKILGMRILTSDVMQELLDFANKTKIEYDICIKGNELYLRFYTNIGFEINNMNEGPLNKKDLQEYFNMLNFTYSLSNKLISIINELEV